jgi:glycosyltransferase involved in cell wall biosynthesis
MRILHVITRLDKTDGGSVTAATNMCEALAARGHEVALYATDHADSAADVVGQAAGKDFRYHRRLFRAEFPPMAASLGLARALRAVKDFDLVHIHALYRFPQAVAAHYCRRFGVPYCVQLHGSLVPILYYKRERRTAKRLYERLVENRNLRAAAAILHTSEGEKQAASFLKLGPPEFIVPNGLWFTKYREQADSAAFREKHRLTGHEVVLWMGRMVPVKAIDVLADAFVQVSAARPNAMLVMAGPDPFGLGKKVRASLERRGLGERVVFTGMLHDDEKLAALKAADLFVLPSHTENFGIAAVEAMAAGCPVIVSSGVKIAPEIAAAKAGKVAQVDPHNLAKVIIELLSNPDLRAELGAAGVKLAARYDWSSVAADLEGAYRSMRNGHAVKAAS